MDTNESGRRPFSVVLYCISLAILITSSIPAFLPKFARVLAVLLVGYIHHQIIFTQTMGDFSADLSLGSIFVAQYLIGVDYALLSSPEDLLDYCDRDTSKVSQRSFKNRVQWTLRLYANPRGIGWAHEPTDLPPRPSPSTPRFKFVVSRILYAIGCFSGVGMVGVLSASNPGLTTPGMLLIEAPLHWRALGVTSCGLGAFLVMSALNSMLSAVVVGCGYSSPERWPRLFGSLFELWSIGRFWRRFWHQCIRRILLSYPSIFLAHIFPESATNTLLYKLARLYSAFFVSGAIHMAGDAMITGRIIFQAFTFFMLQPVGITLELVVAYLWHRFNGSQDNAIDEDDFNRGTDSRAVGSPQKQRNRNKRSEAPIPPTWIRCVGFIWLTFWMAWTAPYFVDSLCTVGVFIKPRMDLRQLI